VEMAMALRVAVGQALRVLEEMFCAAFRLLEQLWVRHEAKYMIQPYPCRREQVHRAIRARRVAATDREPESPARL